MTSCNKDIAFLTYNFTSTEKKLHILRHVLIHFTWIFGYITKSFELLRRRKFISQTRNLSNVRSREQVIFFCKESGHKVIRCFFRLNHEIQKIFFFSFSIHFVISLALKSNYFLFCLN